MDISSIKNKVIAVDFDNTLTLSSKPPVTGKLDLKEVNKIKKLQKSNIIILWTCREGRELEEAINLCKEQGLTFDYINQNINGTKCKKLKADIYYDDKALTKGCFY